MQKSTGKIDTKKIEKKTEMFRWRTESVFTIDYPEDEINQIIKQKIKVPLIKPISKRELKEFFSTIKDFIQEHKDYEYAINFSEGLVSFGSYFAELKGSFGSNEFESFPLGKEIKELIKGNFSQEIIAGILVLLHCVECRNKSMYITLCGNKLFSAAEENYEYAKELDKGYLEFTILRRLQYAVAKDLLSKENKLSLLATIAQMDPYEKPTEGAYSSIRAYPEMYCKLLLTESDDLETLKALVVLECIFIKANVNQSFSLELNAEAYEKGLISERLSQYFLLKHEYLGGLFMPSLPQYILRSDYKNQKFKALVFDFVNKALNAEFSRGSLQTPYTLLLNRMKRIYGMEYYFKAIVALRGLTWVRS
ncbi:MAG: hypothetical protein K2H06_02280, partial [Anaeroplasmataceae bacterium]|nr:hypothetical protein [Anaeroplasmataceae bacterium]